MSINIQLVEIPENEQVSSRQFSLPSSGGTIGRAYDCTVQLPDFSKSLSRVHAQVIKGAKGNYQVSNKSTNSMQINGKEIQSGQYQKIADGDVWKIGDYLLLITDLSALGTNELDLPTEPIEARSTEPLFSVDEFDVMDAEVFDTDRLNMSSRVDDSAFKTGDIDNLPMNSDLSLKDSGFSAEKALDTVQLGIDPFEHEQMQPGSFSNEPLTIEGNNTSADAMAQNLQQLTTLIAQQNSQSNHYNYDMLMQCIQNSMDKFIEEMAPEYLEEMFNGYITGWGSRDKKYWQLYKQQFNRKLARREFHRQFESIFMEELRGKQ
jgi:predicted component of type VI protein secretion system